jgi:hypothetical protein
MIPFNRFCTWRYILNILVSSTELDLKLGRNKVSSLATESTLTVENSGGVGKGKDLLIEMSLSEG